MAVRKVGSSKARVGAGRVLKQATSKISTANKAVTSGVLRNTILKSKNPKVLNASISTFINRSRGGDVQARLFLNRSASEKFNKNSASRREVLWRFKGLAGKGDSVGLRGLMVGVRDSNALNREIAWKGVGDLAARGNPQAKSFLSNYKGGDNSVALRRLISGTGKRDAGTRTSALSGLKRLSDQGRSSVSGSSGAVSSKGSSRVNALRDLKRLSDQGRSSVSGSSEAVSSKGSPRVNALRGLKRLADQ
ncbi:MAG: hypothetical protein BWY55_00468 [archaeon ADurb.Bin336]|nr:MAG: hypothetical protein BWY55_00468 [archaeon ADurb.Bin336]